MFLLAGSIPSEGLDLNLEMEKLVGSFSNWSMVKAMGCLYITRWINYSGLAHHLCRVFGLVQYLEKDEP